MASMHRKWLQAASPNGEKRENATLEIAIIRGTVSQSDTRCRTSARLVIVLADAHLH